MKIGEAIFHITHIQNLSKILEDGFLWCDVERKIRNLQTKGIAYEAIKRRREQRIVPTCKGGVVADYVPFYFAPRSPMLYAIHCGMIENYGDGQEPVIHLVAKIESVVKSELPFTFTDGHAEMMLTEFFDNIDELKKVDWEIMQNDQWSDTEEDGDRKRRRQAEFLVYNQFPISLVLGIGVYSENIKKQVEQILKDVDKEISVKIISQWYY